MPRINRLAVNTAHETTANEIVPRFEAKDSRWFCNAAVIFGPSRSPLVHPRALPPHALLHSRHPNAYSPPFVSYFSFTSPRASFLLVATPLLCRSTATYHGRRRQFSKAFPPLLFGVSCDYNKLLYVISMYMCMCGCMHRNRIQNIILLLSDNLRFSNKYVYLTLKKHFYFSYQTYTRYTYDITYVNVRV